MATDLCPDDPDVRAICRACYIEEATSPKPPTTLCAP